MSVLFDHGAITPQRFNGDVARIAFEGKGEARFRLQHTRDCNGEPDTLSWCDVSQMSNAKVDPISVVDGQVYRNRSSVQVAGGVRGGVLVDRVNGELEVLYRRHIAEWLRVLPLDVKQGDGCCHPCGAYRVTLEETTIDYVVARPSDH